MSLLEDRQGGAMMDRYEEQWLGRRQAITLQRTLQILYPLEVLANRCQDQDNQGELVDQELS